MQPKESYPRARAFGETQTPCLRLSQWIDVFLRLEGRKPKAAWIVISGVFLGLGKNAVFDHNLQLNYFPR